MLTNGSFFFIFYTCWMGRRAAEGGTGIALFGPAA
jgi:hypothetical protein